jgi:hypothetical protein
MRLAALAVAVSLLGACSGTPKSGPIRWSQARALLRACRVTYVEQTHRRLVTLRLRGGGSVYTHEPRIDDVIAEVNRVSGKCGPITLATE